MLAHAPNGDCVYLGATGCTIHAHKPEQCNVMDCRVPAQSITFTQARKLAACNALPIAIWQRGKDLLAGKP